ncbi:tripartite motif-containing protein 16-like [Clarias gariepinus]|uniref:tripartite motif-containing protein 16-like n=1 Tax=Clarias gariepinus TaxID=13013 RepID=UPI00234CA88D|nr:tripartite motif-containing protein 16-like [Clarias gariepinus]
MSISNIMAELKKSEVPLAYEADVPEPTTREELMKYWIPLSLDDRTAQKLLWISEGGAKVSRMPEHPCPVLDRPERYEDTPQVLCKEGLLGCRGYWEVDYEGWVVIGVVYASSGRKTKDGACGLGENDASWAVGWGGRNYQAWHNEESVEIHCNQGKTIGVYVDQPAGIVAFYMVEGEPKQVKFLHRYKTCFKDKLLPGFWLGEKSICWIRKKE